jgi:hypothetical protein
VTVGADGIIREVAVTWERASAWTYTVTYSRLGEMPAPSRPRTRGLRDRLRAIPKR